MKKLINYLILPAGITDTERKHVERVNRVALLVSCLHLPIFILVAYLCQTSVIEAIGFGSLILIGPLLARKALSNPRHISLVYGFTSMCLGALLVHLGQGALQIEMHFHFFVFLALLAVYGNPLTILVATVTVALHHLGFWLFIPSSVFNYEASIWVVAVHALFVVLESIASCFIARSFFDNVIGLEKIIQKRTLELDARNQEMKLILDNAGEGFMTTTITGHMEREKSAIVEQWLGSTDSCETLWDYLSAKSPETAEMMKIGFESIAEDFMPLEIIIDQLPKKIELSDTVLSLTYKPIFDGQSLSKILIIIKDITAELEKVRFEREQKEIILIFESMMRDRQGFIAFLEEAEGLVKRITTPNQFDNTMEIKREIHTLKGISGVFGATSLFDLCHQIESNIAENSDIMLDSDRKALNDRWRYIHLQFERLAGSEAKSVINVTEDDLAEVIEAIRQQSSMTDIHRIISSWRYEPLRVRFNRIAMQALSIAEKLQKGEISVDISDNNVRLPPKALEPFWLNFTHIIRNAVDHGLECPGDRDELGKKSGRIRLSSYIRDKQLFIEIEDNGRGIDWQKLKEKCIELNIPHGTKKELANALFVDGLSTKTEVSMYSGRGVGMSAMRQVCKQLGGHISVTTKSGIGTRFTFRFQLDQIEGNEQLNHVA